MVAEEKPGGALLRHRARAADVQVPQEAAVLTNLGVVGIYQPRYFSVFSDHSEGVIGAVAAQGEGGEVGEAAQRKEASLANLSFIKGAFLLVAVVSDDERP